ncbi:MAG: hypothetical protein R3D00_14510 [Bacteroidia bacterium]
MLASASADPFGLKMAGALHQGANKGTMIALAALPPIVPSPYGNAPYYGEVEYAGRMIDKGWDQGAKIRYQVKQSEKWRKH